VLQPPPSAELGQHLPGGLSPAILAIIERGIHRRPAIAAQLRAEIELNLQDQYPPVRISFTDERVLVEDRGVGEPDLRVTGALHDLVGLMAAPMLGGLPNPIDRRGRAVLALVAGRRVRIEGRMALMRQLLALIRI